MSLENGGSRGAVSFGKAEGDVRGGSSKGGGGSIGNGSVCGQVKQRAWGVLASPGIFSLLVGVLVCSIGDLQDLLFHAPRSFLRPLGEAIQVGVCLCRCLLLCRRFLAAVVAERLLLLSSCRLTPF